MADDRAQPAVLVVGAAERCGEDVAEEAVLVPIPAGTVKSRTFYALRALKQALEERGLAP